ncbi:MAG: hypothetical protein R3211_01330 [Balneolaceae bacterium]|nr:hypothetical protein [Balneolaceae bacterium]
MKKYYLFGFLLAVTVLFLYHFYAANSAEKQITEAIRHLPEQTGLNWTVKHSTIDIQPFSGDIRLSDISIIQNRQIEQIETVWIDLSYWDFLNIYLRGIEKGLAQLESGKVSLKNISYLDRSTLREIKVDSSHLAYRGNFLDLLRMAVTQRASTINHSLEGWNYGVRLSFPATPVGRWRIDSLRAESQLPPGTTRLLVSGTNQLTASSLYWTPPRELQDRYRFLFKGFGFDPSRIPVDQVSLLYRHEADSNALELQQASVTTDLFKAEARGEILIEELGTGQAKFDNMKLRIYDFSPGFKNFMDNLEILLNKRIRLVDGELNYQIEGTFRDPKFISITN